MNEISSSVNKIRELLQQSSRANISSKDIQQIYTLLDSIGKEDNDRNIMLCEMEQDLHEVSTENARLTDENGQTVMMRQQFEAEINTLKENNKELVLRGFQLREKYLDLSEKRSNLGRCYFTSGAERVSRLKNSKVIDPLSEDEQSEILDQIKNDDCLFFEAAYQQIVNQDSKKAKDNIFTLHVDLDSDASHADQSCNESDSTEHTLLTIQEDLDTNGLIFGKNMKENEKIWDKRTIGQRSEILQSINHHRWFYMDDNNVPIEIKEDFVPDAPMGLNGKPLKFVGFRHSHAEVSAMPVQFYVDHYLQATFKETVDSAADVGEAKILLSESLAGQNYEVSGVKKALEEKKNGQSTSTKSRDIFVMSRIYPALLKGCYAAPYLLALIICYKFVLGLPINRMYEAGMFAASGFNVPLSVIEHWPLLIFETKLCYLLPYFKEVLLGQSAIHADETTMLVFRESGRPNTTKSYFWLYSTIRQAAIQVRLFDYEPGRKASFALAYLGDYMGYLITDAYQGYNIFQKATHCFCLIHARRKFFEVASSTTLRSSKNKAMQIITLMDQLFAIEKTLLSLSAEERLKLRNAKMKEIVEELISAIDNLRCDDTIAKSSKLAGAVNYFYSHQKELLMFMSNGDIPLHNMVAENAIRPVAVGRKSWLFCGSPRGAAAVAGIFSIVETAKANGLDPFKYICFVPENMRGKEFMKNEELMKSLLPWSAKAQEKCHSIWHGSSMISQVESVAA